MSWSSDRATLFVAAHDDRRGALLANVRLDQDQRSVARVRPLVNPARTLEMRGSGRSRAALAVSNEYPGSAGDIIQDGARSVMRRVRRHTRRHGNSGQTVFVMPGY